MSSIFQFDTPIAVTQPSKYARSSALHESTKVAPSTMLQSEYSDWVHLGQCIRYKSTHVVPKPERDFCIDLSVFLNPKLVGHTLVVTHTCSLGTLDVPRAVPISTLLP